MFFGWVASERAGSSFVNMPLLVAGDTAIGGRVYLNTRSFASRTKASAVEPISISVECFFDEGFIDSHTSLLTQLRRFMPSVTLHLEKIDITLIRSMIQEGVTEFVNEVLVAMISLGIVVYSCRSVIP